MQPDERTAIEAKEEKRGGVGPPSLDELRWSCLQWQQRFEQKDATLYEDSLQAFAFSLRRNWLTSWDSILSAAADLYPSLGLALKKRKKYVATVGQTLKHPAFELGLHGVDARLEAKPSTGSPHSQLSQTSQSQANQGVNVWEAASEVEWTSVCHALEDSATNPRTLPLATLIRWVSVLLEGVDVWYKGEVDCDAVPDLTRHQRLDLGDGFPGMKRRANTAPEMGKFGTLTILQHFPFVAVFQYAATAEYTVFSLVPSVATHAAQQRRLLALYQSQRAPPNVSSIVSAAQTSNKRTSVRLWVQPAFSDVSADRLSHDLTAQLLADDGDGDDTVDESLDGVGATSKDGGSDRGGDTAKDKELPLVVVELWGRLRDLLLENCTEYVMGERKRRMCLRSLSFFEVPVHLVYPVYLSHFQLLDSFKQQNPSALKNITVSAGAASDIQDCPVGPNKAIPVHVLRGVVRVLLRKDALSLSYTAGDEHEPHAHAYAYDPQSPTAPGGIDGQLPLIPGFDIQIEVLNWYMGEAKTPTPPTLEEEQGLSPVSVRIAFRSVLQAADQKVQEIKRAHQLKEQERLQKLAELQKKRKKSNKDKELEASLKPTISITKEQQEEMVMPCMATASLPRMLGLLDLKALGISPHDFVSQLDPALPDKLSERYQERRWRKWARHQLNQQLLPFGFRSRIYKNVSLGLRGPAALSSALLELFPAGHPLLVELVAALQSATTAVASLSQAMRVLTAGGSAALAVPALDYAVVSACLTKPFAELSIGHKIVLCYYRLNQFSGNLANCYWNYLFQGLHSHMTGLLASHPSGKSGARPAGTSGAADAASESLALSKPPQLQRPPSITTVVSGNGKLPVLGVAFWDALDQKEGGLMVSHVTSNKPADKAGVKAKDILESIGGHRVFDRDSYMRALSAFASQAGHTVLLHVRREGRGLDLPCIIRIPHSQPGKDAAHAQASAARLMHTQMRAQRMQRQHSALQDADIVVLPDGEDDEKLEVKGGSGKGLPSSPPPATKKTFFGVRVLPEDKPDDGEQKKMGKLQAFRNKLFKRNKSSADSAVSPTSTSPSAAAEAAETAEESFGDTVAVEKDTASVGAAAAFRPHPLTDPELEYEEERASGDVVGQIEIKVHSPSPRKPGVHSTLFRDSPSSQSQSLPDAPVQPSRASISQYSQSSISQAGQFIPTSRPVLTSADSTTSNPSISSTPAAAAAPVPPTFASRAVSYAGVFATPIPTPTPTPPPILATGATISGRRTSESVHSTHSALLTTATPTPLATPSLNAMSEGSVLPNLTLSATAQPALMLPDPYVLPLPQNAHYPLLVPEFPLALCHHPEISASHLERLLSRLVVLPTGTMHASDDKESWSLFRLQPPQNAGQEREDHYALRVYKHKLKRLSRSSWESVLSLLLPRPLVEKLYKRLAVLDPTRATDVYSLRHLSRDQPCLVRPSLDPLLPTDTAQLTPTASESQFSTGATPSRQASFVESRLEGQTAAPSATSKKRHGSSRANCAWLPDGVKRSTPPDEIDGGGLEGETDGANTDSSGRPGLFRLPTEQDVEGGVVSVDYVAMLHDSDWMDQDELDELQARLRRINEQKQRVEARRRKKELRENPPQTPSQVMESEVGRQKNDAMNEKDLRLLRKRVKKQFKLKEEWKTTTHQLKQTRATCFGIW